MVKAKSHILRRGVEVFLAFGSNLGNRFKNIKRAIKELEGLKTAEKIPCVKIKKVSSFYKSRPYPGSSGPYYLNAAAKIFTTLSPFELLKKIKEIEKKLGRNLSDKKKNWGEPRPIDIDIIYYDDEVIAGKKKLSLVVPHKSLHLRDFVLKPLAEIAPRKLHPIFKKTASEMLMTLKQEEKTIFDKIIFAKKI